MNLEAGKRIMYKIEDLAFQKLVLGGATEKDEYTRLLSAQGKSLDDLARDYQLRQVGLSVYPTWMGNVRLSGCMIASSSHDARASYGKQMRTFFSKPFALQQLVVDNSAGTGLVEIDPASAKLYNGEQLVASAMPSNSVLSTAKKNPEKWTTKYGGKIRVEKGARRLEVLIFLPPGTSMKQVTHITVTVNGATTTIPGRLLSVEELMKAYKLGRQMQQKQKRQKAQ